MNIAESVALRRPGRCQCVVAGVLILQAMSSPAFANQLGLELLASLDGTKTDVIEVELDANETTGGGAFWLRKTGSADLTNLKLGTDPGKGATVAFTVQGQGNDGSFTAAAYTRVQVEVSNVTRPGQLRAPLYAQQGNKVAALGSLVVRRVGALTIEGVGISATEIAGTTEAGSFQRHYRIVSDDPRERTATLVAIQLVGPDGKATATRLRVGDDDHDVVGSTDISLTIPAYGSKIVAISTELPVTGVYTGIVYLKDSDGRSLFSRTVNLTRTGDSAASFSVAAPSNVEIGKLGLPLWAGSVSATLNLAVTEDNKSAVTINNVHLVSLDLVKGQSKTMATRGPVVVRPDGATGGNQDNATAASQPGREKGVLTIERNQTGGLHIIIPGLVSPGQYDGKLRLSSANSKPVDATFKLFVRRNAYVALATIIVGVLTAIFLRWLGTKRQQNQVRVRIAQLRKRLQEIVRGSVQSERSRTQIDAVHDAIMRRTEQLEAMILGNPEADLGTELEELESKIAKPLRDWLELLARADNWGLLHEVDKQLQAVQQFLRQSGGDEAGFTAAETRLQEIRAALRGRDLRQLKADIEKQRRAVEKQRAALSSAAVEAVIKELESAKTLVDSDPAAARAALAEAWRNWIRLFVEQVASELPPKTNPPLGFADAAAWSGVREKALQDLRAAVRETSLPIATQKYRDALTELLDALLENFESGLADVKTAVGAPAGDTDKQRYVTALDEIAKSVQSARGQLTADKLEQARAAHNAAAQEFEKARKVYEQSTGQPPIGDAPIVAMLSSTGPGLATAPAMAPGTGPAADTEAKASDEPLKLVGTLETQQRWIRVGWSALALFIIGIMGLEVLYLDNATWGTLKDFIVAFLWGLGLHSGTQTLATAVIRTAAVPGSPG